MPAPPPPPPSITTETSANPLTPSFTRQKSNIVPGTSDPVPFIWPLQPVPLVNLWEKEIVNDNPPSESKTNISMTKSPKTEKVIDTTPTKQSVQRPVNPLTSRYRDRDAQLQLIIEREATSPDDARTTTGIIAENPLVVWQLEQMNGQMRNLENMQNEITARRTRIEEEALRDDIYRLQQINDRLANMEEQEGPYDINNDNVPPYGYPYLSSQWPPAFVPQPPTGEPNPLIPRRRRRPPPDDLKSKRDPPLPPPPPPPF
eukprot:NODE_2875_length_1471_cov_15.704006_g2169_i1.p1 GENE.NODE_2875_length_1471_cov_15.704006_g2169_i1~~NODE_2875_length_1471_cov_15.704006_g2169_i1.p1  ORF type:complete len:259 (-),score=60.67 NODE_2875_length_1471_cov_15.704006_g2169_i1:129-905(-)